MTPEGPRDRGRRISVSSTGSKDAPLVLYALAMGVLAVTAGAVINETGDWGKLNNTISISATVIFVLVAGFCADSVLAWLSSYDQDGDPQNRS